MLSFHQVCASYGKNQVLDHIDFSLVPHKLTAVVGRNGSGKSTLVSCVNQELPYTGEITFSDRNLAVMTLRERAQLISILPQTLHSPAVTVEELTAFGRNPYLDFGKRMSPKDWQAVDDALEAIGISGLRDKLVTELSGGERQKAYLAMVLAQNTRVMILDEPTTYMDMEYEAAFFRLLETLKTKRNHLPEQKYNSIRSVYRVSGLLPYDSFRRYHRIPLPDQKRLPFLLHSILKSQEYCSPQYGFRHRHISDILSRLHPTRE